MFKTGFRIQTSLNMLNIILDPIFVFTIFVYLLYIKRTAYKVVHVRQFKSLKKSTVNFCHIVLFAYYFANPFPADHVCK